MRATLLLLTLALPVAAQEPPRAIRRTVPITRTFEAALRSGTRDSTGRPGPRYWQLRTDYRIDARLDAQAGRIIGRARITIHNPSDTALRQVVLRLYQNRFNGWSPRGRVPPSITTGITIYRLNTNGVEQDVKAQAPQWATSTVAMLALANPIAAGGSGTVEVEWVGDIPDIPFGRGGARGGRRGLKIFQLSQWYPQVAVYDDLRGWDREPHLGASEFYNNFGRFEVNLDLPAGFLVGATGTLLNPEEIFTPAVQERLARVLESDSQQTIVGESERGPSKGTRGGNRLVWRFVADTVNDFAWAASADFVWDATRATIPGRGTIPVHLLYLPENSRYRQTGAMARHALEFYSRLWFPYAFPQFTQVDGPEGGMEYPMLTMSGPGFGVTDHEIGHQWWPMMVGNNETWYGWMDEGFNQYMNVLSDAAFRGKPAVLDSLGGSAGQQAGIEAQAPMMWNNNYGGPLTGYVTYSKAPMMLSMLGAIVGDSAVVRAMRSYAADWRFRHPSPWDFMFAMNRELGRNLDWFWYAWLFTTESVDGGIERVAERGRAWEVTVRQRGEMPAPIVLAVRFVPEGPAPRLMKNAVLQGNEAIVTWPVETWFDGRRSRAVTLDFGGRRIASVTLDPAVRFPDRDRSDNRWPR
jgi:hypothetical protein